ncbi:MAG TPA: hypothetical protein VF677_05685 [Flavobacterium sp.]|jgi:hypothetical protein
MKNLNLVLATDKNGKEITIQNLENWIRIGSKIELADFFYDRFHVRYLKPFEFENIEYIKTHKNGFAIMTSCCLLIETFVSFTNSEFKNTKNKSERSFGYFFLKNKEFNSFSKGGLDLSKYEKQTDKYLNNKGIPKDFYSNVRCGILHNGETKNNWKILRKGELFDEKNKAINATKFMNNLVIVIKQFQNKLLVSDFNNDEIWKTYKARLEYLIEKSYTE